MGVVIAKHHASILLLLAVAFFSCCWSAGRHCIVPPIEALRGRDGRDGRDGAPGPQGSSGTDGMKGMTGDTGLLGPPGPSSGGATYVRWGRTTCPNTTGTELVYSGRAAGTWYTHNGGSSDYLCLPEQPEYMSFTAGTQGWSPIYGAEYQTNGGPLPAITHQNVPCAVCDTGQRGSLLMIPARVSCPASWTLEYSGYLMTELNSHRRRSAACVDKDPEAIPGLDGDSNGALFYHTEAVCNGIACPPYDPAKELTCAVCTK